MNERDARDMVESGRAAPSPVSVDVALARGGEFSRVKPQRVLAPDIRPSPPIRSESYLFGLLEDEVKRQDAKHGPFQGTDLGRTRLALACLEDEVDEAKQAWRDERKEPGWSETRREVLQVAAVAFRALRDAL